MPDRIARHVRAVRSRVAKRTGGVHVWRAGIAVVGLVVIIVGVLLLVLPGPGWVIIFVGLGIWAHRVCLGPLADEACPATLAKVHGMAEATPSSVSCAWPLERAPGKGLVDGRAALVANMSVGRGRGRGRAGRGRAAAAGGPGLRGAASRRSPRIARSDNRLDRAPDDRRRSRRCRASLVGRDRVPAGVDGGDPPVREVR